MASLLSTEGLAERSAHHPWRTIVVWVVLFLVGGFGASQIAGVLTTEFALTNNADSVVGLDLIEDRLRGGALPATEIVIVKSEDQTVDSPAFQGMVGELVTSMRAQTDTVASVVSYYEAGVDSLVSADRKILLIPVTLTASVYDAPAEVEPLTALLEEVDARADSFTVLPFGQGSTGEENNKISEEDLQQSEMIGMPAALVILVLVFGALLAAVVPIVLALIAITLAMGLAAAIGQIYPLTFFVTNMIVMIGLAVGIDYSLFIVARYREERRQGLDKVSAVIRTGATANKAVLFSGFTVVVALAGMLLVPSTIMMSLAVGAIVVVIAAVLAALTLLPAVLSLVGDRVNWGRIPLVGKIQASEQSEKGFWAASTRLVMSNPWASVVLTAGVLAALAVSYFTINLGFNGADTFPEETKAYRAFQILDRNFSAGLANETQIVVDAPSITDPDVQTRIENLRTALRGDAGLGESTLEVNDAAHLAVVEVPIAGDSTSREALDTLARLRDGYIPAAFAGSNASVYVTGYTAGSEDFFEVVDRFTPIVFAFVLGFSFLILLVAFRSIVVPIKAIIMNLLSVGAAYGLLVLVFQHGVGASLFGFVETPKIDAWIPLFMFSVLFGLSMDYHVFLLSRIRERYDLTHDNDASVAFGIRTTASIITGAALIMVAVFGAFAASDLVGFQQVGFGLSVAVILDATVVRTVLVPASMKLLGDRNWYFPRWLEWLPEVHIEGKPAQPAAAPKTVGAAGR